MSDSELIAGQHAVNAVMRRDAGRIIEAWLQRGRDNELARRLLAYAKGARIAVHEMDRARLNQLFPALKHQGVVVRARAAHTPRLSTLLASLAHSPAPLLLVLDGVEDPHNLGACLRSADAAGANAVLVPRSRGAGLTPTARKVASGAAEHTALLKVANLARALSSLSEANFRVVGLDAKSSKSLFDCDLTGATALVLGAEGRGIRALTARHCDELVSLPMRGEVESLNVSVSAGICLYEALRQRGH